MKIFTLIMVFVTVVQCLRFAYYYKLGDIKMRDNEINVKDVEFKESNFVF